MSPERAIVIFILIIAAIAVFVLVLRLVGGEDAAAALVVPTILGASNGKMSLRRMATFTRK